MAKKSKVAKEQKRQAMVEKYAAHPSGVKRKRGL